MSGSYRHAFETPDLRLSGLCALPGYVPFSSKVCALRSVALQAGNITRGFVSC